MNRIDEINNEIQILEEEKENIYQMNKNVIYPIRKIDSCDCTTCIPKKEYGGLSIHNFLLLKNISAIDNIMGTKVNIKFYNENLEITYIPTRRLEAEFSKKDINGDYKIYSIRIHYGYCKFQCPEVWVNGIYFNISNGYNCSRLTSYFIAEIYLDWIYYIED